MKKMIICLGLIFILSGCSNQDKMVCTLKNGSMTNVLNMEFEDGKLLKTSTEYTIALNGATEEDANKTLEETKAQYIADGFTNVEARLNNNKVLVINADVNLVDFINLDKYKEIKAYYKKLKYECK